MKTKKITISEKEYVIREMKMREIKQIAETMNDATVDVLFKNVISFCVTPDLTIEDILDGFPSDISITLKAFEEVNSDFLQMLKEMAGVDAIELVKKEIKAAMERAHQA